MDKAYKQIGGFGRFQWVMLILIALVRNYGNFAIYGAELAIKEPIILCKYKLGDGNSEKRQMDVWKRCTSDEACFKKMEYKFDRTDSQYF